MHLLRLSGPSPETGTCCIHGSTIWQISDGVAEFGPWQWRSWSVRVRSNGLRMVDGVAGPVHWRAIWQVASMIDWSKQQTAKERTREKKQKGNGWKERKCWQGMLTLLNKGIAGHMSSVFIFTLCRVHFKSLVIIASRVCARVFPRTHQQTTYRSNKKIELQDSELMKLHSPKTNTAPAGRPSQKETHLNQPQCFSCYVSFREGNTNLGLMKKGCWFHVSFKQPTSFMNSKSA